MNKLRMSTTSGAGSASFRKTATFVAKPALKANKINQKEAEVTRVSLRDQHNAAFISNHEQKHFHKSREFYENQVEEGKGDNLAKFIEHRVNHQVEAEMLDFKTEIWRELSEHREDNHMQIEHHFREFHHRRWVDFRYLGHPWHPYPIGNESDMIYDPNNEEKLVSPGRQVEAASKRLNSDLEVMEK